MRLVLLLILFMLCLPPITHADQIYTDERLVDELFVHEEVQLAAAIGASALPEKAKQPDSAATDNAKTPGPTSNAGAEISTTTMITIGVGVAAVIAATASSSSTSTTSH